MKTVAIIPARRNSVRIPGKNWKEFHGKPIIQYSIETAQRSRLFDHIIVSTDGDEIEKIALRCGAWVFKRPVDDGLRGTQDVAAEALAYDRICGHALACVIYPTAPMLTALDLWHGMNLMHTSGSVYSYAIDVHNRDCGMFYWGPAMAFGAIPLVPEASSVLRIPEDRAIDINTPEDWAKAEQMYAAWKAK